MSKNTGKFVSMLKLEPFMALMAFVLHMKLTPLDLLLQDKLCQHKYNMTDQFCANLSNIDDNEVNYNYKTLILSDVVTYKMIVKMIIYVPGNVISLFLGSWSDRYMPARKIIMVFGSFAMFFENAMNALSSYYFNLDINWVLVSFIPYSLSGAMAISNCYAYIATTTPKSYKTLRMTVIDILFDIVEPSAILLSGVLIEMRPLFGNGLLHNYCLLYLINSCAAFAAFVWALVMVDEREDMIDFYTQLGDDNDRKALTKNLKLIDNREKKNPLLLLFDLKNIQQMVSTYAKKRPNRVRARLLLLTVALFCNWFVVYGPMTFQFQFAEKMYNWSATTYNYVTSFGQVISSVAIMAISPLLIKKFKLDDMIISIVGFTGLFIRMSIRGLVLSPTGFYASIPASVTSSLGSVGFRSNISKIVDVTEVGKVFTIVMVVGHLAPVIASALLAHVFESTIETTAGASFLILAAVSLIPIFIAIILMVINAKYDNDNDKPMVSNIIGRNNRRFK